MRVQINEIRDFDNRCKNLLLQEGYIYETVYSHQNFCDGGWAPVRINLIDQKTKECIVFTTEHQRHRTIMAYFCPHCAAEFYAEWLYYGVNPNLKFADAFSSLRRSKESVVALFEEEAKTVQNMNKCPVCGNVLSHEKGFYLEDAGRSFFELLDINNLVNNPAKKAENNGVFPRTAFQDHCSGKKHITKEDYISDVFDFMQKQRDEAEKSWAEKEVDTVEENNSISAGQSFNKEKIQEIKTNTSALNEYLDKLIKLELNIYSLKKYLSELYCVQKATTRNVKSEQVQPFYEKLQEKQAEYLKHLAIAEEHKNTPINFSMQMPVQPAKPVLKEAGLFNKKKVMEENEALQEKYQADMKEYEAKVQLYEQQKSQLILERERQIAEEFEQLEKEKMLLDELSIQAKNGSRDVDTNSPAYLSKSMIDKEVSEAEALLIKLCACRTELYEYNIVFGKYRNVVALSTFCEYLMAGRCTTLEGADGAYNLYEDQVRAEMIIGQLSQVIAKLDEIKESQYMIYSELQKVNKSLDQLNSTMDKALSSIQNMEQGIEHISANTDVIAHNTAVTAYYSRVNAQLADSLGYMIAFK